MFQNKGFTMIEMLFVLSIIVSITLLTIPYYFTHQNNYNFENVQKQIGMMIDQAKQESLISHQRIDLCFTKKEVYYLKDEQKISFQLPDKFYFDKIKEVYFKKNGNINQANHIVLSNNQKKIKIVFHLGSGEYEFQS
ncbi:competence type IV pilus minor pilin ComGD [Faecalibacillus faecis]|uniref:competence type IV pilus minor pilin ComGD n=1 Tax=Faecalibacillus faecis TaxID=1982628 RepID=UPI0032C0E37F